VQPKKTAGGAYGLFVKENRAAFAEKVKGQPATAVCKLGGEAWKKLSEAERKPYDDKYTAAKAKFETDMAAFLAAGGVKQKGPQALRSAKRKAKEVEKKNNTDASNAPKPPAGAAYGIWFNAKRSSIVESLPAGHRKMDLAKAAAEMWKALPTAEKKPFEEEYKKKKVAYKAALKEYRRTGGRKAEETDDDDEGDDEKARQPPAKKGKKTGK